MSFIYHYSSRYFLPFKTNTSKLFVVLENTPIKNVHLMTFEHNYYNRKILSVFVDIINIEIKKKNILERLYDRFKKR